MQIERGMQPNCSELIIRLKGYDDVQVVKDELDKLEIREYLLEGYYDFEPKMKTQWDEEDKSKEATIIKDLPKNTQKLLSDYNNYDDQGKQEKARTKLNDLGIDIEKATVVLLDGEKPIEMPHGTISISKNHDNEGIAIVGHQHCNWDMFPILKKISEYFGEEVHAYYGGSLYEYERFLNGEEMTDE